MRRGNWFGTAIFIFCIVFVIAGLVFIRWPDFQNHQAVHNVLHSRSAFDLSLRMTYDKPPIYSEEYLLRNNNGVSTTQYRIQGYSGKVVTITLPPSKTYEVTFFFQQIEQDGLWELMNKPPAANTSVKYRLYVHEIAGDKQGSRTVLFTDPHYWATTAGRQYQIELNKNGPLPDLTKLKSTQLADPRYQEIVQAFRNFGPPEFRQRVSQAQQLIRASH
jgi:hypothetical protein